MKLQSRGSPENAQFRDAQVGVPGVSGQNGHLDATPAASHRVYYKGEGSGFPQCRNPSFGLATKAKGIARVRAKGKPGS